jgi:hypothetical protein
MTLGLQEKTKSIILVLFFLCTQAYLDKIKSPICPLIALEKSTEMSWRRLWVLAREFENMKCFGSGR